MGTVGRMIVDLGLIAAGWVVMRWLAREDVRELKRVVAEAASRLQTENAALAAETASLRQLRKTHQDTIFRLQATLRGIWKLCDQVAAGRKPVEQLQKTLAKQEIRALLDDDPTERHHG